MNKKTAWTIEDAMAFLKSIGLDIVEVSSFNGLLVDYAKQIDAQAVIRGLRAVTDFENEFQRRLK